MSRRSLVAVWEARRSLKGSRSPLPGSPSFRSSLSPCNYPIPPILHALATLTSTDIFARVLRAVIQRIKSCRVVFVRIRRTSTLILAKTSLAESGLRLTGLPTGPHLQDLPKRTSQGLPTHIHDMDVTVAEAVARATQEQQQQQAAAAQQAQQLINQPSPPVQPVQNASSTIDNLTCQWQGCGERCDSAEALYVCISSSSIGTRV